MDGEGQIEDKYGLENEKALDKEDKDEKKQDLETVKREDFLNIYKEGQDGDAGAADDSPDLSNGIKFKHESISESNFELKTSQGVAPAGGKPLIQEIGSKTAEEIEATQKAKAIAQEAQKPKEVPFSWEKVEFVELKTSFITHSDFVFVNINLKGY